MFDLSIPKILVLAVLGLLIFGPDQLPKMAAQAGRMLRELRRMADNARAELTDGLGPEFRDLELSDLNPKAFVRKHLLDDLDEPLGFPGAEPYGAADPYPMAGLAERLAPGEVPPYDFDAT